MGETMIKIFLLMHAISNEPAEPLWALDTLEECQAVADILNNNASEEYLYCIEAKANT